MGRLFCWTLVLCGTHAYLVKLCLHPLSDLGTKEAAGLQREPINSENQECLKSHTVIDSAAMASLSKIK